MYADYSHNLLQVSASLHHYYGLENRFDDHAGVSEWLERNQFRCVAVLLIDAMGDSVLKQLPEDGFFRHNTADVVSSVFPPTTTASTISFLTGKTPKETGWLGWNQWFEEKQDAIIPFMERSQYGTDQYPGFISGVLPVERIYEKLNAKGIPAASVWPSFGQENPCASFAEIAETVVRLSEDPQMRFIYAYWDALDSLMHRNGPFDADTKDMLEDLQAKTEWLADHLPEDCGLMVIADHSQIPAEQRELEENSRLADCLRHVPTLEPRTIAFHVKEGREAEFEELFRKEYGDVFRLFTHQEVLDYELFGDGAAFPRFEEFIGDYLAVAETYTEMDYRKQHKVKGSHAGGMKEEFMIPVILSPSVHKQ